MVQPDAGRFGWAGENPGIRWKRTVRKLPRHPMGGHFDLVDIDAAGAAFGIDTAQPHMMFARAVHLPFETCSQIFDRTPHGLIVSVSRISRRIWVGLA
jgi:hypothetical protein